MNKNFLIALAILYIWCIAILARNWYLDQKMLKECEGQHQQVTGFANTGERFHCGLER